MKDIKLKDLNSKGYEELYVNLDNVREKRSNILFSIKSSLYLQEDYEKVLAVRKKKTIVQKEIKKELTEINQKYQELKKLLPNVKGIISYTEKELGELDSQINTLKRESRVTHEEIKVEEGLKEKLIREFEEQKKRESGNSEELSVNIKKEKSIEKLNNQKKEHAKKVHKEKLSKLDRIKNNLKVIESKIKDI